MDEPDTRSGEEPIDETGRNPIQRDIDEHGASDRPVDVEWEERGE